MISIIRKISETEEVKEKYGSEREEVYQRRKEKVLKTSL